MHTEGLSTQRKVRNQARYRVTYEPNYDHEAWHSEATPTLESHPDAFYPHRELVNPRSAKSTARKAPHATLSIRALKKRLYRAGIASQRAAEIAREIHAGPGLDALMLGGSMVLRWPAKELERRYGKRIARAVTRFVRTTFIVLDEAWSLTGSDEMADLVQSSFQLRRYNSAPIEVSQSIEQLAHVGYPSDALTSRTSTSRRGA